MKKLLYLLFFMLPTLGYATVSLTVGGAPYHVKGQSGTWVDFSITCSSFTVNAEQSSTQIGTACGVTSTYQGDLNSSRCGTNTSDTYKPGETYPAISCSSRIRAVDSNNPEASNPDWYNDTKFCGGRIQGNANNGAELLPGESTCTQLPPSVTDVSCTTSDVAIDHGDLSIASFSGATMNATGKITCKNGDATAKLSISPPTISFSNGGKSSLSIGASGQSSTTISIKDGENKTYSLTSTLSSAAPVTVGDFSGSTTIITDLQ